jgi:very-short-patch-repair endonuclease
MIASRVAAGPLQPLVRGVFAVGHRALGREGVMLAAVLACGDSAVVSHGSAAELLGLWDRRPVLIDVTAPSSRGRELDGIRWHRGDLLPDEVSSHAGVPCTTASRTLIDMAGRVGEKSLRRMVEQAAVLRLLDLAALDRILGHTRRRGAPLLRSALAPWRHMGDGQRKLRSRTEARLLAAVVEAGLPRPRCNVVLRIDGGSLEVDLVWERQRLVVETDGVATHGTSAAFQRDRRRDQLLTAAGYRTARVTWQQLEDEQAATVERIRRMLDQAVA